MVARGEVWLVALDPSVGSEIRKTRPCVIVSPPEMHDYLRTVIVAPMTTGARPAPYRIAVTFQASAGGSFWTSSARWTRSGWSNDWKHQSRSSGFDTENNATSVCLRAAGGGPEGLPSSCYLSLGCTDSRSEPQRDDLV